uniref:Epithelial stromal interaction 1 n=1 Tax=Monopterus albus TaxID=43700 RepID=A0A3Q3RDG6_MONAL
MDPPHHDPGNHLSSTSHSAGNDQTADNPAPDHGNPPAPGRQPQYSGAYTMFPPKESLRREIQMVARQEEEALQRLKETRQVPSVHLNPERLGGEVTLAEARAKQSLDQRCSRLQKKLKKEDLDKRRRQEEEEKLQQWKAAQREKAEQLEEKNRQAEQRRREQLKFDHFRTNEGFLQRTERRAPGPVASSSATHTSSRSEAVESKQERSVRDVELERQRVNSAFLDKLEGRGRGMETEALREAVWEAEGPCVPAKDRGIEGSCSRGSLCPC